MLTLQLLLSVGTPLVLKFGLYRHATFVDWKESGTSMATSLLFLVIFVIMGFSGAVGLLAVCMQRTGSLVLTILMQMGTAATTTSSGGTSQHNENHKVRRSKGSQLQERYDLLLHTLSSDMKVSTLCLITSSGMHFSRHPLIHHPTQ